MASGVDTSLEVGDAKGFYVQPQVFLRKGIWAITEVEGTFPEALNPRYPTNALTDGAAGIGTRGDVVALYASCSINAPCGLSHSKQWCRASRVQP